MGGQCNSDRWRPAPRQGKLVRAALTLLAAFLLAGCFAAGDAPLLDRREATTQLPARFALAGLDARGQIETGSSELAGGLPALLKVGLADGEYRIESQGAGARPEDLQGFRLYPLDGGWLGVELRTGDTAPAYYYTILRLAGDTIELAVPSRIGDLGKDLEAAGIAHEKVLGCCSFDDPAALRRALTLATGKADALDMVRYRVVTDAETVARLDKLALALAKQERAAEAARAEEKAAPEAAGPIGPISDLATQVLASPWARTDGDYRVMRVEFYRAVILQFSVKPDRSVCTFLIAFRDRRDGDVNKGLDRGCDGTLERIQLVGGEAETRPPTRAERDEIAPVLAALPALFDAVDDFATYTPRAQLALLPDPEVIGRNRALLQDMADAATASALRPVPDPERRGSSDVILKIWVGGGRDDGGFEVFFLARTGAGNRLYDCYWGSDGPEGEWSMIDDDCDAIPESASERGRIRVLNAAGNEKAVQGMLLDVARFARVANERF